MNNNWFHIFFKKKGFNSPFRWPISLVIWWRRLKKIIPTVAMNENNSTTIEIKTMNHGSWMRFCGCFRCWWWSSRPLAEPLGCARGGVTKWLGSIVNATCRKLLEEKKQNIIHSFIQCAIWQRVHHSCGFHLIISAMQNAHHIVHNTYDIL